jgi:hypothetical protein
MLPQQPPCRSPPRAGSPLASPRCAAAARAATHPAGLPAPALARPSLLLDPKHVLELPTNPLLLSRVCISTALSFPEFSTLPEPRCSVCSPSTAAAAASHPQSSDLAAPPRPTEAHKPAQFRSLALDQPDHSAGELELLPPLGLAVVPAIHCLLAPAAHTISTTSPRGSFLATSPPLSCPSATGTPSTSLGAPLPVSVRRRCAATVPLYPNTGHPVTAVSS